MKLLVATLARKVLSESSVAKNITRWGTGALNIDASRIGTGEDKGVWPITARPTNKIYGDLGPHVETDLTKGRWPANLVLIHKPECRNLGPQRVKASGSRQKDIGREMFPDENGVKTRTYGKGRPSTITTAYVDDDGTEMVDAWDCTSECPVGALEDAGVRPGSYRTTRDHQGGLFGWQAGNSEGYDDEGSAARYFKQIQRQGGSEVSAIPEELIEYLRVLIAPPPPDGAPLVLGDLSEVDWEDVSSWEDNTVTGIIARGTPTEAQSAELMRVLLPGAHLLLIAPDEQPTGHTGACRLEDTGFEIRDAILLAREAGAMHYVPKASRAEREAGCWGLEGKTGAEAVEREEGSDGMASPRAGANRNARKVSNFHPTVKPVDVMVRLMGDVPPDAIVCDPFMGSGTTGVACAKTGHNFVGIEREDEYIEIADARIRHWRTVYAGHGLRADVESDVKGTDDISIEDKPDTELMDLFWEE